jgi:hypothetical protein
LGAAPTEGDHRRPAAIFALARAERGLHLHRVEEQLRDRVHIDLRVGAVCRIEEQVEVELARLAAAELCRRERRSDDGIDLPLVLLLDRVLLGVEPAFERWALALDLEGCKRESGEWWLRHRVS